MTTVYLDSPDTGEHITRSMVTSIANDIIDLAKLPKDKLIYTGEGATALSLNSALGVSNTTNTFGNSGMIAITVAEEFDEEGVYTSSMTSEEHLDVFTDKLLGLRVKPIYTAHTTAIEFTYTAADKTSVTAWRSTMRRLLETGFLHVVHSPKCQFPIHPTALDIIAHVHHNRENVAGYGESLGVYMKNHMASKVSVAVNMAGNNPTFMVNDRQLEVQGVFEFDLPPTESKTETSAWEVSFSYKVKYVKPSGFKVTYPISVHNQVLGMKYRPRTGLNELRRLSNTVLSKPLIALRDVPVHVGGIRMPTYDEWEVPNPLKHVSPLLRFLVVADQAAPDVVLDLNDLGKFTLTPELLDYLTAVGDEVFRYGGAGIHIGLYRGDKPVGGDQLSLIGNVVHIDAPMRLREQYRLTIGLSNDLSVIDDRAITLLCDNPTAGLTILAALEPMLSNAVPVPRVFRGRLVEREFRVALEYIRTTNRHYRVGTGIDRARAEYCITTR